MCATKEFSFWGSSRAVVRDRVNQRWLSDQARNALRKITYKRFILVFSFFVQWGNLSGGARILMLLCEAFVRGESKHKASDFLSMLSHYPALCGSLRVMVDVRTYKGWFGLGLWGSGGGVGDIKNRPCQRFVLLVQ